MVPSAKLQLQAPPLRYLTKSLVKAALKCPKKLVYATHPKLFPQSREYVEDPLHLHLSMEGERFGSYCKRLFPHGTELQLREELKNDKDNRTSTSYRLSSETHRILMSGCGGANKNKRVTVFEGVACHGALYAQPDILDKIVHDDRTKTQRTELRVIEVKSKSWDSRFSVQDKMLSKHSINKKTTVKVNFLPYIQDIAFQSMVFRLLYSQEHDMQVSSWLMMPDRSKKMKCSGLDYHKDEISSHETSCNDHPPEEGKIPTLDETSQTINNSIATLLNVDELVEIALSSEVSYPGSNGDTLQEVIYRWAEQVTSPSFGPQSFPTPIGMHCSSCEYRLKDTPLSGTYSGFHKCWQEATGYDMEMIRTTPLIVDLYGNTKKLVTTFLSKEKYTLSGLSTDFFELAEDGSPAKKSGMGESISNHQRQWYQIETTKRLDSCSSAKENIFRPSCTIRKNRLDQIMKSWKYPLHFIDFETISPVIPLYPDMSPYEIFAFQFSHHILHDASSSVEHATEFLHREEGSPNVTFLRALHRAICSKNDDGTVFQWSPHEHNVLKVMLSSPEALESLSPQEYSDLTALLENGMVDLCKLAQKYYYVDGSGGSSSIKRLLRPTIEVSPRVRSLYGSPTYNSRNFSNFQWHQLDDCGRRSKDPYDILSAINEMHRGDSFDHQKPQQQQHDKANVTKGGAAAAAFQELQNNTSLNAKDRRDIEKSLLRYCELDTLAMVMIVQAWQNLLEDNSE